MLKESKNKIIAVFQQNIDALKKEIKGIDEKYKKLAEEEKKELKEMLEYYKTQRDALSDGKKVVAVPQEPDTTEQAPDVEEKIEDTIFPENNEEPQKETEKVAAPEDTATAVDEIEDLWLETKNTESAENTGEVNTGKSEKPTDDNDGWPAFPEEWEN
jgi:hypothetical protein